jgi:hypothetical protein
MRQQPRSLQPQLLATQDRCYVHPFRAVFLTLTLTLTLILTLTLSSTLTLVLALSVTCAAADCSSSVCAVVHVASGNVCRAGCWRRTKGGDTPSIHCSPPRRRPTLTLNLSLTLTLTLTRTLTALTG